MNKAFEKILERLDSHIEDAKSEGDFSYIKPFEIAKRVVREVAEEYNNGWIKVEFHEITEQEREENHIPDTITYWLDCRLPDNEEEIICTDGKKVWIDTNWIDDGYSLDSGQDWIDIVAWQPLPEPYRPPM